MTIYFNTEDEVQLSMYDMIQKLINFLPNDMVGEKNTAAPSNLFDTSNDKTAPLLEEKVEDLFHTITATTSFISQVRLGLELGTGFCCTRVKNPNQHDYIKLSHMMKYLQKYKFLQSILGIESNGVSIYLDGTYTTHSDIKGHIR